jgi:hypothetical protein
MTRLPRLKGKDVIRILQKAGFEGQPHFSETPRRKNYRSAYPFWGDDWAGPASGNSARCRTIA